MSEAPFLFDDFFVDEADPGVEHTLHLRGRAVPIQVKRGISLADREAATQAAVARHVDEQGRVVIDGMDDAKLSTGLLARLIKSWPFTRADGTPVEVTPENVGRLIAEGADQLLLAIKGAQAAREAEADGPFVEG